MIVDIIIAVHNSLTIKIHKNFAISAHTTYFFIHYGVKQIENRVCLPLLYAIIIIIDRFSDSFCYQHLLVHTTISTIIDKIPLEPPGIFVCSLSSLLLLPVVNAQQNRLCPSLSLHPALIAIDNHSFLFRAFAITFTLVSSPIRPSHFTVPSLSNLLLSHSLVEFIAGSLLFTLCSLSHSRWCFQNRCVLGIKKVCDRYARGEIKKVFFCKSRRKKDDDDDERGAK